MAENAKERCGSIKHGGVTLQCTEPAGHEPDWHRSVFTDHREISYDGAHHVVDITEVVTWDPAAFARAVHAALRPLVARGTNEPA